MALPLLVSEQVGPLGYTDLVYPSSGRYDKICKKRLHLDVSLAIKSVEVPFGKFCLFLNGPPRDHHEQGVGIHLGIALA